jgi:hypothetical protein
MDAAILLSLGPADCCSGVFDRDDATRLSSGPPVGRVVLPPMEAAILLSFGLALGREPTDAATALSSGPPSERSAGCDCSAAEREQSGKRDDPVGSDLACDRDCGVSDLRHGAVSLL